MRPLITFCRAIPLSALVMAMVVGCGFHLRGGPPVPAGLQQIHLASINPYGDLMRKLKRQFEILDVETVPEAGIAPWALSISGEKNTRRALTTTSLITVAEYELQLEVEFQLARGDGELVIPPTTLIERRVYVLDRTSLAGSSEEEELLKGEMQDEMVAAILRRVAAVTEERGDEARSQSTGG